MNSAISSDWLPEIIEVNISEDLVPQLRCRQPSLLPRIAAVRAERGDEGPLVRIRDEPYLADGTYTISIHGIRIAWGRLQESQDLEDELVRAIAEVWDLNREGLRFLVEWRAAINREETSRTAAS